MDVLITGATGFVGRALVLRLRREGHRVTAWVRSPERARALLGEEIRIVDAAAGPSALDAAVDGAEAIVNLAGAPILPRRWSAARRRALTRSRVGVTDQIVQALARGRARSRTLISASAVGFYGDRGADLLTESSRGGSGFLAKLCAEWEAAAERASAHGARVVTLRTGIVLGPDGGMLARLLPLFRAGFGGVLGSGEQYVPWIHLDDLVELIARALGDPRYSGPLNATAPHPVSQREFTHELASTLGRSVGPRVPAFALRALLGEASSALLGSQRALPERPGALGFTWSFPELPGALRDLVQPEDVAIEELADAERQHEPEPGTYLARRRPRYVLRSTTTLESKQDEVFEFFSKPQNLGAMTPSNMAFQILGEVGPMRPGAQIDYRIRMGALPLRWRTTIESFRPATLFIDSQERGPYRAWWHEHRFRADGDRTVMEDRVYYALPFGWLGRLVHRYFVSKTLVSIFQFRAHAVRLRFGAAASSFARAEGAE